MSDDFNEPVTPAEVDDEDELDDEQDDQEPVRYRGTGSDPTFGYLLALALSFGLLPLIPYNADMRFTLAWGVLGLFGVISWLFGTTTRIGREPLENLAWGVVFGLIVSAPLLLVGGNTLTTTSHLIFQTGVGGSIQNLSSGTVLAYLVFVMPLGETLFFRGFMQQNRSFWLVGVLSSVWSIVLFVPMLDVGKYPLVAVIISIALVLINLMYGYVRERNGLAAAWACQIVVNFVLLFLPYLTL
ncbi:MAG TPA: CPBP family glutamic-type intramembrane protease [Phototrophicaceae bacterium]|nr:CPBP family glutamic-type intramembrane protease [Phototrophicaceae bacterium]